MTLCRMRIACWIHKAIDTHLVYVTLIACPLHRWLHERASIVRYTYVACFHLLTFFVMPCLCSAEDGNSCNRTTTNFPSFPWFSGIKLHKSMQDSHINLLTPNVNYSGRTAPLTSKVAFYIFTQQI